MSQIAQDIFKAYDIRGIADKTLTEEASYLIGKAIATQAREKNIAKMALGRDGRLSGPSLMDSISHGLTEGGIDVIDIDMVATPMLYFAAIKHCEGSGIMITGSHNPPDYNGFKIMLAGDTLASDGIQQLFNIIKSDAFVGSQQTGQIHFLNITEEYQNHIVNHIKLTRPMSIAIDAGNGVGGAFAGNLYRALGCKVTELFCDVDGRFPNHHPDPAKPKNLQDLIQCLQNRDAEIGLAFDGDADRLGVVTKDGNIIYPDRQLMLFAKDVLDRHPGAKIIYDVKSTRLLAPWIKQHGGEAIMEKTGHSFMKSSLKKNAALLAGEMSGHIFFKERWLGFDDGLYAGCRLLEILSRTDDPSSLLNALPQAISTPELNINVPENMSGHQVIEDLSKIAQFDDAENIVTIDGLRVEYQDGFGLIRASNTTPVLVLRFEADNDTALSRIQNQFKNMIDGYLGLQWPSSWLKLS